MLNTEDFYHVWRIDQTSNSLREEIKEYCHTDIEMCLECGKCSGGCSNAHIFDITPRKIIQLIKMGEEAKLLKMDALWSCVACQLCVDRCPSSINIPRIMDYMREKAYKQGVPATRPNVELFHELMLGHIKRFGRVPEALLSVEFNIRSKQYTKDAEMGMKMFFKGKLNPIPARVKNIQQVQRMFRNIPAQREG
ncbi:cob--com heterodisulfide reductase subunit c [hydrocarbon metagenome]|uniref:Cob--com heterodisulfide reductase subunit c n=1 Tax=hydrocarbon metagenome TaxID=938273 RepID=A0A0W8E6Q0_9ZZZZ